MPSTPARLLQALDFVTGQVPAMPEALGDVRASHFAKVKVIAADKNVVGVGISEKQVEGKASGDLTVCFYVKKKLPPSRVLGSNMVPSAISLPSDKAVFTDVKEIGQIQPEALPAKKSAPIQSGFSVGHFKSTAGTVAAIVRKTGVLYILSNSHVLAQSGKGKVGDKILYPGPADGGTASTNLAATLSEFIPFDLSGSLNNKMDAALAEIVHERISSVDLALALAGEPLTTIAPERDMKIVKVGRTTGRTSGKVVDVNFRFTLKYPNVGSVGYLDQVLCTRYTDAGDSGSLVIAEDTKKIVGLHFAGANGGSVFSPIIPIVKSLGFKFVSTLGAH